MNGLLMRKAMMRKYGPDCLGTERNVALKRALTKLEASDDPDYAYVIDLVERILAAAASWPPVHYTRDER